MAVSKKSISNIIIGVIALALGAVLFFQAEKFLLILLVGVGIVAALNGVGTLLSVKSLGFKDNIKKVTVVKGIILSVMGIVSAIAPWFVDERSEFIIAVAFGVVLIFAAIIAVFDAVAVRKLKEKADVSSYIIEIVIDILLSVVLVASPAGIVVVVSQIIGIGAAVIGAVLLIIGIRACKVEKAKAENPKVAEKTENSEKTEKTAQETTETK